MIQEDFMNYYTYFKNWNEAFDGKLIDSKKLDELLDNIEDLTEEFEQFSKTTNYLSKLTDFPKAWDNLVKDEKSMKNHGNSYTTLLDITTTLNDAREIFLEMNTKHLKIVGAPDD